MHLHENQYVAKYQGSEIPNRVKVHDQNLVQIVDESRKFGLIY